MLFLPINKFLKTKYDFKNNIRIGVFFYEQPSFGTNLQRIYLNYL